MMSFFSWIFSQTADSLFGKIGNRFRTLELINGVKWRAVGTTLTTTMAIDHEAFGATPQEALKNLLALLESDIIT